MDSVRTPDSERTETGDSPSSPAPASLGSKVRSAARWSLINTLVMRLGNFATGILLARFALGPAEWGVYGIAQTVLLVLLSANELGVGLAIIRWEGDPRRFAPTVLTLSVLSSGLLYVALFVSAPTVAGLLGSPDASGVLRVMCLCLVIDAVAHVPAGILTREFAQGRRMVIDALNFVLSTAVTLVLAFAGWGAMSFACGAVVGNVAALVGCAIAVPGTLRFGWDREQARALLKFGLPLAGASLLALAVVNVDTMVVGSSLGQISLGFYVLAFNMSGWPVRVISEAARRVSFAGFSRLADSPQALAQGFSRALGVLVTGTVPLCVLLGGLAAPVVHLVYGGKWLPAAEALPWLMALGLIRIVCELAYDCLVAVGQRRSLILVQGLWVAALVPVLIVGARTGGIVGVAQGHVLVGAALVVPVFLYALARAGIGLAAIARACLWPFLAGAAMILVLLGAKRLLGDGTLALFAVGATALACYVVCVLPSRRFLLGSRTPETV
ncbi:MULTISPECIES: oligosaccharide flippase family protein [unclassified Streptomyces]|uniref:oligosaccharide flippase family protein n=1 Tax=unclassified Streptomyces TaxID=2593676 RepID=UPI000F50D954|nr:MULTISPECIES: oligosaccharide flippase family protein [unclassified Streptomyces]MDH6454677.1 O-antigen/teichoic acid export membrane protein [Streptomyces sp. SAI-119]MDH6494765.1 O-antigen/teichoic acid export membrane protein [Streptomyces sp. SAI-149]QUC58115.1 oligosaccharide flippase family protein [Streptomyces sp. A2-16]